MQVVSEKGASNWLATLPIAENGLTLDEGAYRDAFCLHNGWLYHLTASVASTSPVIASLLPSSLLSSSLSHSPILLPPPLFLSLLPSFPTIIMFHHQEPDPVAAIDPGSLFSQLARKDPIRQGAGQGTSDISPANEQAWGVVEGVSVRVWQCEGVTVSVGVYEWECEGEGRVQELMSERAPNSILPQNNAEATLEDLEKPGMDAEPNQVQLQWVVGDVLWYTEMYYDVL